MQGNCRRGGVFNPQADAVEVFPAELRRSPGITCRDSCPNVAIASFTRYDHLPAPYFISPWLVKVLRKHLTGNVNSALSATRRIIGVVTEKRPLCPHADGIEEVLILRIHCPHLS